MPLIKRKKPAKAAADLPVLTELSDTNELIPVLTEQLQAQLPPGIKKHGLSDEQLHLLVNQLAPQLQAMLYAALQKQFETRWQQSWHDVEQQLPELIRAQLNKGGRNAQ